MNNLDDIEIKIETLKKNIMDYNKLSNTEKICKIEYLNKLIKDKDDFIVIFNELNKNIKENKFEMDKTTIICDQILFVKLVERISEIKELIGNNNLTLKELIKLNNEFRNIRLKLDSFLQDKKMQIINI